MMDGYEVEIMVYRRVVRKALRRICRKRTGMREDGRRLEKVNCAWAELADAREDELMEKLRNALGVRVRTELEELLRNVDADEEVYLVQVQESKDARSQVMR